MVVTGKVKTGAGTLPRVLDGRIGVAVMVSLLAISALLTACGGGSAPLATISFTASSSSIAYGGSTTLTWSVSGASSASISGGIGTVSLTGSKAVSPTTATTYTLTATNSAGVASTATVAVGVGPQILSFTPSASTGVVVSNGAATATVNSPVTLTWIVASGASVAVSGGTCTVSGSSCTFTPTATGSTTLTLTASDTAGDKTTATVAVTAIGAPAVAGFSAQQSTIAYGNSSTLTWTVPSGASNSSVTIVDSNGATICSVTCVSGVTVKPSADDTYTLTATNAAGTALATSPTATVDVMNLTGFVASPTSINLGGTGSTLSWTVTHDSTLTLQATDTVTKTVTNTTVTGDTSYTVNPTEATSYVLIATDSLGDTLSSSTVSLTVTNTLGAVQSFMANNPSNDPTSTGVYMASTGANGTIDLLVALNTSDQLGSSPNYTVTVTGSDGSSQTAAPTLNTAQTAYTATLTATPAASTDYTLTVNDTQNSVSGSQVYASPLRVVAGNVTLYSGTAGTIVSSNACMNTAGNYAPTSATVTATAALYCDPTGLTTDSSGNLYVADAEAMDIVQINASTHAATDIAGLTVHENTSGLYWDLDGPALSAILHGMTVYPAYNSNTDTLYFWELLSSGSDCAVRMVQNGEVSLLAGIEITNSSLKFSSCGNDVDAQGANASFNSMGAGPLVDSVGDVIVPEYYSVRSIDTSANVVTIAGDCYDTTTTCGLSDTDGVGTGADFYGINAAAIDSNDVIWIADGSALRKMVPTKPAGSTKASQWTWTVSTVFNSAEKSYKTTDGSASVATLYGPSAMAVDANGVLYFADNYYIRRYTPSTGVLDTIAGSSATLTSGEALPGGKAYSYGLAIDTTKKVLYFTGGTDAVYFMPY